MNSLFPHSGQTMPFSAMYADICSCVHPSGCTSSRPCLFGIFFNKLVRTETGFAALAVHKRVVEVHNVSAGYPNLRVHQYGAVETDIVFAFLHKFAPPCLFYVVFASPRPEGHNPTRLQGRRKVRSLAKTKPRFLQSATILSILYPLIRYNLLKIYSDFFNIEYDTIGMAFVQVLLKHMG